MHLDDHLSDVYKKVKVFYLTALQIVYSWRWKAQVNYLKIRKIEKSSGHVSSTCY